MRRSFLQQTWWFAATGGLMSYRSSERSVAGESASAKLRVGLVADLHHAEKAPQGTRHYRETVTKFAEAAEKFTGTGTDLVICLGDLVDSAEDLETEKRYVTCMAKAMAAAPGEHHYVLGNHCVSRLTKSEFLTAVGQEKTFYSFDRGGWHFVVLDACFRKDGAPYGRENFDWRDSNIPSDQVAWLRSDLEQTRNPSLVFVHQRLDVQPPFGIKNAEEVRSVLEGSGRVRLVFQGHEHRGAYNQIDKISYCTLKAMVEGSGPENNAFALLEILSDGGLRMTGFRHQASHGF